MVHACHRLLYTSPDTRNVKHSDATGTNHLIQSNNEKMKPGRNARLLTSNDCEERGHLSNQISPF